jgi:lipopolysaccharide assembly outer membrane protein LptD (OstA)
MAIPAAAVSCFDKPSTLNRIEGLPWSFRSAEGGIIAMNLPRNLCLIAAALFVLVLWQAPCALAQAPTSVPALHVTLPSPVVDKKPMLVQADEVKYDYRISTVSAFGHVQIQYGGATIEADRAVYHQRDDRLRARGNAKLTELDGRISYARTIFIRWVR